MSIWLATTATDATSGSDSLGLSCEKAWSVIKEDEQNSDWPDIPGDHNVFHFLNFLKFAALLLE